MDGMWLRRNDRIETLTTEMLAGSIAGALLAVVETAGATVVATDDAVLVMPRSRAQEVMEVVSEYQKSHREGYL